MIAKINSAALIGLEAKAVEVEIDLGRGLPRFEIVGLAENAVKEGRNRVIAAIQNSGFEFPAKRITVNLAPATLPKEGSLFDLPIALAILMASKQLPAAISEKSLFIGELALDGRIRAVRGALPMAIFAKENRFKKISLPAANMTEANCVRGVKIIPLDNLATLVGYLNGDNNYRPNLKAHFPQEITREQSLPQSEFELSDVCGQIMGKRALQIAAAGFHHLLMIGPPGAGKSMLAKRLPGLLPQLTEAASLESTRIHSVAGELTSGGGLLRTPPFRSPHHTVSAVGMSGGGSQPSPGEISLAHNGVLFMDEFPEFRRDVLESLRQPLENGKITICRAAGSFSYPTRVLLVAAMNPCPCGYYGEDGEECGCSDGQIRRYMNRLSGPLLDRFDLQLRLTRVNPARRQSSPAQTVSSADLKRAVLPARTIQQQRFGNSAAALNGCVDFKTLLNRAHLAEKAEVLLEQAIDKFRLSARAYSKIIRVARTIADLEQSPGVTEGHLAEALQFRFLSRCYGL